MFVNNSGNRKVLLPKKNAPTIPFEQIWQPNREIINEVQPLDIQNNCSLKELSFFAKIDDLACNLKIKQKYTNETENPKEVVFKIPLFNAFVSGFRAIVDEKNIVGIIDDTENATNTYDDQISSGNGSFLGKIIDNNFEINIGNLPPNKSVELELELDQILKTEGGEIAFVLQPELFPKRETDYIALVNVEIKNSAGIEKVFVIEKEDLEINQEEFTSKYRYLLKTKTDLKTDFVTIIQPKEAFKPMIIVEKSEDNKSIAMLLNYYPSWDHLDEDLFEPTSEIVFVVDRSGSMEGNSIKAVRDVLLFFLKSLPDCCKFNIVGFGSNHQNLFPKSVEYDEKNLKIAQDYASKLKADMGGTNLFGPLKSIFSTPYDEEYPRQIFILTDGGISNTEDTLQLVKTHSGTTRVFSLGIGDSVSENLVMGLAKEGKGICLFVSGHDNETMKEIVLTMLKSAIEPIFKNCKLDWKTQQFNPQKVYQYPAKLRPVFNGERLISTCLLTDITNIPQSINVSLFGKAPDGKDIEIVVPINLENARVGNNIHKIAANEYCNELEEGTSMLHRKAKEENKIVDENEIKKEIIFLSKKYQFATTFTSFIAWEERNEIVEGSMKRELIPLFKPIKNDNTSPINLDLRYDFQMQQQQQQQINPFNFQQINLQQNNQINLQQLPNIKKRINTNIRNNNNNFMFSQKISNNNNNNNNNFSQQLNNNNNYSQFNNNKMGKMKQMPIQTNSFVSTKQMKQNSNNIPTNNSPTITSNTTTSLSNKNYTNSQSNMKGLFQKKSDNNEKDISEQDGSDKILLLQKTTGNWDLKDAAKLINLSDKKIKQSNPVPKDSSDLVLSLWCTSLVVAYLNFKCSESKGIWVLVESKAKKYIKKNQISLNLTDIDFLEKAKQFIESI